MKYRYHVRIEVNISAILPAVKTVEDELNKTIKDLGVDQSVAIRTVLPDAVLTADRELTAKEQIDVGNLIVNTINNQKPDWKAKLDRIWLDSMTAA